ncbi:MAG: glutamine amidotransferase-related protein [Bacilli bacterium]
MILYLVTQAWEQFSDYKKQVETRTSLEECAEDYCDIVHYSQVTPELLQTLRPWAVCHSGGRHAGAVEQEGYRWCVTEYPVAQIGFCAGHQLSAKVFGSEIGPMRKQRPDGQDLNPLRFSEEYPDDYPEDYKEEGVFQVKIQAQDSLFEGLDDSITVWQNHRYHIIDLSPQLRPIASSANCAIEAWVHRSKPFYGVQFHPEVRLAEHPDGFRLLTNFFRIARSAADAAS